MDGCVGFHAALRQAYNRFVKDLSKQCKQLVRHHLDSVTSPYSLVGYETDFQGSYGSSATSFVRSNHSSVNSFLLELSDVSMIDQENNPPEKNVQQTTSGKGAEARDPLRECQMTVPETPSPDQPRDDGAKKDLGNGIDIGPRKRVSRMTGNNKYFDNVRAQNGDDALRSGSPYTEICSSAAQHFARIREVLVERNVASALNSGFLTPW